MDLITLYLDEQSDREIQQWIMKVSEATGNDYMLLHHVPVHLTLLSIDTRNADRIIQIFKNMEFHSFEISLAGILSFSKRVLGIGVVYSEDLYLLQRRIFQNIEKIEETKVSRYYHPFSYMPHITIAKKLEQEQLINGFAELTRQFHPIQAKVVKIGLSKVNPYQDLYIQELK